MTSYDSADDIYVSDMKWGRMSSEVACFTHHFLVHRDKRVSGFLPNQGAKASRKTH